MARLTPQQQKDMLKRQEDLYGDGEEEMGGSATAPGADDLDDAMKEAFGEEPEPGEPVDIAEKVDEDENALKDLPFAEEEDE